MQPGIFGFVGSGYSPHMRRNQNKRARGEANVLSFLFVLE